MKRAIIAVYGTVVLVFCSFAPVLAQESKSVTNKDDYCNQSQALKELVLEIKKLTITLGKFQFTNERRRFHQERLMSLKRDLADTKLSVQNLSYELNNMIERQKSKEEDFNQESDIQRRKQLQEEIKEIKYGIELQRNQVQYHQARENQISADIAEEENQLAEAVKSLDDLERSLANPSKNR